MSGHSRKLAAANVSCRSFWPSLLFILLPFLFPNFLSGHSNITVTTVPDQFNQTISQPGNETATTLDVRYSTTDTVPETNKSLLSSTIATLLKPTLKSTGLNDSFSHHHHHHDNLLLLRPAILKESFGQSVDEGTSHSHHNARLLQAYSVFYHELQVLANELLSKSAQSALNLLRQLPISSQCFSSLVTVANGLRQHQTWAIQCKF